MPYNIEEYMPASGRMLKEDNSIINIADIIHTEYNFNNYIIALNRDISTALITNRFILANSTAISTSNVLFSDTVETLVLISATTTLTIISTSTADATAGDGANTIVLSGLDANKDEINETVNLNGTTEVTTTNPFFRFNGSYIATAGQENPPTGTIYIGSGAVVGGVPTILYGVINPNSTHTNIGRYSTPRNYFPIYIEFTTFIGKGKEVIFTARDKPQSQINWVNRLINSNYQNIITIRPNVGAKRSESIDLEILAESDIAGTRGTIFFEMLLVSTDF